MQNTESRITVMNIKDMSAHCLGRKQKVQNILNMRDLSCEPIMLVEDKRQ